MGAPDYKPIRLLPLDPDMWDRAVSQVSDSNQHINVCFGLSETPDAKWLDLFYRIYRMWYSEKPPEISGARLSLRCAAWDFPLYRALVKSVIAEANERVVIFRTHTYDAARADVQATKQARRQEWYRGKRKSQVPISPATPTRLAYEVLDQHMLQTQSAESSFNRSLLQFEMNRILQILADEDLREAESITERMTQTPAKGKSR